MVKESNAMCLVVAGTVKSIRVIEVSQQRQLTIPVLIETWRSKQVLVSLSTVLHSGFHQLSISLLGVAFCFKFIFNRPPNTVAFVATQGFCDPFRKIKNYFSQKKN